MRRALRNVSSGIFVAAAAQLQKTLHVSRHHASADQPTNCSRRNKWTPSAVKSCSVDGAEEVCNRRSSSKPLY
ncbi:hypothetical protein LIPSTDRAFT_139155 [Lipomyces starkeyi NRRL Y-11557]|uniref:Uncharacterized protein n=1 Tax=Lipomyces starkeyi NRRL Y-11557 TaxID=675824 RepID=A0A1E3QFZ8_LIPST|nr:hypothetical protein LIPSTDRAFT_139155 [Lipomyces starkeyi NRRL Y-11557]